MAGEAAMSKMFAVVGGGVFLLTGLFSVHPFAAAQPHVEPTAARPGEIWTVYGAPANAEIRWSLTPQGSLDMIPLTATYDSGGIARVVVPRVEPGQYELVGRWYGSGDVEQFFHDDVAVLEAPRQTSSAPAEESADISAGADAGVTKRRDQPPVDRLGFRFAPDAASLAVDVVLVAFAGIVLGRSRWIRLIVFETVRHPRRRVTLERRGGEVTVRLARKP